jgi:hypothetical protein
MFNLSEDDCNGETTHKSDKSFHGAYKQMLLDLLSTPARTPGGIAWKCRTVLNFFANEESWAWWRYLLKSAVTDAIDLERARTDWAAAGRLRNPASPGAVCRLLPSRESLPFDDKLAPPARRGFLFDLM